MPCADMCVDMYVGLGSLRTPVMRDVEGWDPVRAPSAAIVFFSEYADGEREGLRRIRG